VLVIGLSAQIFAIKFSFNILWLLKFDKKVWLPIRVKGWLLMGGRIESLRNPQHHSFSIDRHTLCKQETANLGYLAQHGKETASSPAAKNDMKMSMAIFTAVLHYIFMSYYFFNISASIGREWVARL
jgi:hypothetical protein